MKSKVSCKFLVDVLFQQPKNVLQFGSSILDRSRADMTPFETNIDKTHHLSKTNLVEITSLLSNPQTVH